MNRRIPSADTCSRSSHWNGRPAHARSSVSHAYAPRLSTRALLVFANPAAVDCEQRKWPLSFRQLFNTERFRELEACGIDVHLFTSVLPPISGEVSSNVHVQRYSGTSFGTRLEDAVAQMVALGYNNIVIIGSDCPSLQQGDVLKAFSLLENKRVVLGPDHRGGCYLIGIHADDRPDFSQIRWHKNTDFLQILSQYDEIAVAQLPCKIDIDNLQDLFLLADSASVYGRLAAELLRSIKASYCAATLILKPNAHRYLTLSWQLPPPQLFLTS